MKVKKIILLILIAAIITAILLSSSGCCQAINYFFNKAPKETKANKESDKIAESVNRDLIDSNTDFAFKIFKVFISPVSISIAMAMLYNGANNQTKEEIATAMEFKNFNADDLNKNFKVLLSGMTDIDEMVELYTGNSIWCSKGFSVEKDFTDLSANYYNASVFSADFGNQKTVNRMNGWVSDATKGNISNIVSPGAVKDAVMFLINAIYFKGQWKDKFKVENTQEDDFFLADNNIKRVQMMQNNKKYNYCKGEDFQMLKIPYGRDKSSMCVLLPNEGIEINNFISRLSKDLLNKVISGAFNIEVMLKFPKFNVEYGAKSMINPLKNLGIKEAFLQDKADFGKIAPQLYVSQIEHKAIIMVDEEGTVAAAATIIGMGETAVKPLEFTVNRPFVLLIRDDRTGNILFMGKIMEP
jgi:serine protease inhibitor